MRIRRRAPRPLWRRHRRSQNRRRIRKKWVVIAVFGIAFFCFFSFRLRPMMQSITATVAKQVMTRSVEEAVKQSISALELAYNDFVTVERDSAGNILGITTNMVNTNRLKAELTAAIEEKLIQNSTRTGVPVGTLLGSNLLRGYGPDNPLRVGVIGSGDIDFQSSFESAGINQTVHKIYLTIHTSCYAYLPGLKSQSDVDTSMVVAETVIVGEVPNTYANFQLPGLYDQQQNTAKSS